MPRAFLPNTPSTSPDDAKHHGVQRFQNLSPIVPQDVVRTLLYDIGRSIWLEGLLRGRSRYRCVPRCTSVTITRVNAANFINLSDII